MRRLLGEISTKCPICENKVPRSDFEAHQANCRLPSSEPLTGTNTESGATNRRKIHCKLNSCEYEGDCEGFMAHLLSQHAPVSPGSQDQYFQQLFEFTQELETSQDIGSETKELLQIQCEELLLTVSIQPEAANESVQSTNVSIENTSRQEESQQSASVDQLYDTIPLETPNMPTLEIAQETTQDERVNNLSTQVSTQTNSRCRQSQSMYVRSSTNSSTASTNSTSESTDVVLQNPRVTTQRNNSHDHAVLMSELKLHPLFKSSSSSKNIPRDIQE